MVVCPLVLQLLTLRRLSLEPGISILWQTTVDLTLAFSAAMTISLGPLLVVLNPILVMLVVLVLPIRIMLWLSVLVKTRRVG